LACQQISVGIDKVEMTAGVHRHGSARSSVNIGAYHRFIGVKLPKRDSPNRKGL
jgi:hypothetical protein